MGLVEKTTPSIGASYPYYHLEPLHKQGERMFADYVLARPRGESRTLIGTEQKSRFQAGRDRLRRIRVDEKPVGYDTAQGLVPCDDNASARHRLAYRLVETPRRREIDVDGMSAIEERRRVVAHRRVQKEWTAGGKLMRFFPELRRESAVRVRRVTVDIRSNVDVFLPQEPERLKEHERALHGIYPAEEHDRLGDGRGGGRRERRRVDADGHPDRIPETGDVRGGGGVADRAREKRGNTREDGPFFVI